MDAYTPRQESARPVAATVALSGSRRKGRGVGAVLVLLPLLVMAANAWSAWRGAWRSAAADLEQTAAAGAEFGLRVLSAHAIAAGRVDAVLRGLSDDEIRAREPELHAELKALVVEVPQAEASYVVDRNGYPLLSANLYPLPRALPVAADRDFFIALRDKGGPDPHVSRVHEGRYDWLPFFAVSRRRTRTGNAGLPPGGFDGLVNLSLYPDRLRKGLSRVSGHPGDAVALVRDDGAVLVRGGGPKGVAGFPRDGHALVGAAQGTEGAFHRDGGEAEGPALVAVRQVEGWPVHAAASRTRRAIVAGWQDTVAAQLAVGLPASLALLGLALLLHRSQGRLALANAGLEASVAQRTAELAGGEARFRATFEQPPSASRMSASTGSGFASTTASAGCSAMRRASCSPGPSGTSPIPTTSRPTPRPCTGSSRARSRPARSRSATFAATARAFGWISPFPSCGTRTGSPSPSSRPSATTQRAKRPRRRSPRGRRSSAPSSRAR